MSTREVCKACWGINAVGFHVSNEVWAAVVPERLQGSVLCLACFARFGDEAMVSWDNGIELFPVSLATHLWAEASGKSPIPAAAVTAAAAAVVVSDATVAAPLQSRLVGGAESYTGSKSCGDVQSLDMTNRNTNRNTPSVDHKSDATHAMTAGENHTAGGCDDTDFSSSDPRP